MKKYKSKSKTKPKNNYNKKKGGKSFLNYIVGNVPGPLIPDNIKQNISLGKKDELLNEYELMQKNAETNFNRSKDENKEYNVEVDRNIERRYKFVRFILLPIIDYLTKFFKFLYDILKYLFRYVFKTGGSLYTEGKRFLASLGSIFTDKKGSLFTLIIFIIFVIILILIIFNFFNTNKSKRTDNTKNNLFKFDSSVRPQNVYNMLSEQVLNLIPEEYRYQFNGFRFTLNRVFGNDIISNDIDSINRENINTGRYDGIYHIKKENTNYVNSILEPKSAKFNININDYQNSDYFKLPKDLREKYFNTSSNIITIPPEYNNNLGKYIYKISNAYYGDDINNKIPQNDMPFEDVQINDINYLKIRNIPIEKNIFSEKDNINNDIFQQKLLIYKDNKYVYPEDYIQKKIN
jgi:hypothetical protein